MRRAKSYSIIDHQLLHGGYLKRLSHQSMILYFFLALVGDRDGKSFYKEETIGEVMQLNEDEISNARTELIQEGLIQFKNPFWQVKSISKEKGNGRSQE